MLPNCPSEATLRRTGSGGAPERVRLVPALGLHADVGPDDPLGAAVGPGCRAYEPLPQLVSIVDVGPRASSQGDTLELTGASFPVKKVGRVVLLGDLLVMWSVEMLERAVRIGGAADVLRITGGEHVKLNPSKMQTLLRECAIQTRRVLDKAHGRGRPPGPGRVWLGMATRY